MIFTQVSLPYWNPMKKFYVQSGNARWVLSAKSNADAAFRLVQLVMNESFVPGKQPTSSFKLVDQARAQQLVSRLTDKVSVTHNGFDSLPRLLFDTNYLLKKWQRKTSKLERLIRQTR